ncbi:ectonucleoside triphosphate diphosphohydrolase 5-like isoform X2 [Limulus polyphemus]|nr:ectonucleoside triphosphate diphosphohydrolase 5-like isoform X2 [Limulus polyphemus]XP_013788981.1 ectonucleoside triphosphate diphosphohydrolase 5-like isoform X2 [Limulus polyphemus]XP_013788982.1 ectonucleoside triphosphate diphosphohydrolase 5-like isoform X2 [Limulus polyphemus]XP_013788983.1 ectonucleoside triphosphate diphosphohydrolase 5-like isoform X2 [Limulus polyphemus]
MMPLTIMSTTLICGMLLLVCAVTYVGPFSTIKKVAELQNGDKVTQRSYAIVFDGGSTGTRIHVFTFLNSTETGLTLLDEYFQEVKPGLSSYAESPSEAASSIVSLLEKAKTVIPSECWSGTPLSLKATAGLRFLPSHTADAILDEVDKKIKSYPFLVSNDSVSIMDGDDEGIFAWYTVNFLLGHLSNASHTVVTLDLGGGSTQITFQPTNLDMLVSIPKEYLVKLKIQEKPAFLYTHSYLGNGLMSARLSILQSSSSGEKSAHDKTEILRSPCIHPLIMKSWQHGGMEYLVMGLESGNYGFDACFDRAKTFVGNNIHVAEELKQRPVYAMSYYYDRAVDSELIDKDDGGVVLVEDFLKAAKKACSSDGNVNMPFLCLDLTYIASLLYNGFDLNLSKEITLVKKIKTFETSWGLGAAFNLLARV